MKGHKGQSVVEFALVLPLFLFIMFGVIYTGMMFHDYTTLSNIARSSAREAAISATQDYTEIANYYKNNQLDNLMTSFYKKADANPIVIEAVTDASGGKGIKTTINMQLNVKGFFVDMILPKTFGVQYYMRKEPFTSSSKNNEEEFV